MIIEGGDIDETGLLHNPLSRGGLFPLDSDPFEHLKWSLVANAIA